MRVCIFTLGCKTNYCDGEAMAARFAAAGHTVSLKPEPADLYIINTCSVTGYSDHKSRQAAAKARRLNSAAKIYVAGCGVQSDAGQFDKYGIAGAVGTGGKVEFVDRIIAGDCLAIARNDEINLSLPDKFEEPAGIFKSRKRGFVKVQDGCDNYCTYCIVPYLRGKSRSRGPNSIVAEAAKKAEVCSEVVLTGINLSAYGKDLDPQITLVDLMCLLGSVGVKKRLGSLSPVIIDEQFLTAAAENNFVPEFHIPLQSGSDDILKAMGRRYTAGEYIDKIALIRRSFPAAVITTDVICGFPAETDADHAATVRVLRQLQLNKVHVFPFSSRPGTKAASMDGKVDEKIIKQRADELSKNTLQTSGYMV